MSPEFQERLSALERAGGSAWNDRAQAEQALRRYLAAAGLDPDARAFVWGEGMTDALARAASLTGPAPTLAALRDPRLREVHVAARLATWPDGDPSRLAPARWREALDAARAIARNAAWGRATATWVGTLGDERFAKGSAASLLGTSLAPHALDAQLAAVGVTVWPELAAGRPVDWLELEAPQAEAFLAGVYRFWVLPMHVVIVPRAPVA